MASSHDHHIVPLHERRAPLTMGLLWISMIVFFPGVLVGFVWHKEGLSLSQVLICTSVSCVLMMMYALPAAHIGSLSGQSYGALIRGVFGKVGNRVVAANLVWMFIAWYGLCSLFLAEGLKGLFHWNVPVILIAPALAMIMACNNFWGFKGVANFARFFAAPLLIAWVFYTLFKTVSTASPALLTQSGTCSFELALSMVANFVIGVCVWGNEADYWRHGKPKLHHSGIPIFISYLLGMIVFPTTGWMVASMTGISDYGKATEFMNDYSFGGIAIVGAVVLIASYFAANDSNLYGSTNGLAQLVKLPHRVSVILLTVCGGIVAALMSFLGCAQAIEKVTSLNCVIMAMPTVILGAEYFLIRRWLKIPAEFSSVATDDELPGWRLPAMVALVMGCAVGILTAGVLPGCDLLHVGICSVQAWLVGLIVYVSMRCLEHKREQEEIALMRVLFESTLHEAEHEAVEVI